MKCNTPPRTIFCKDNLDVLRGLNSKCIDLVYLDPPFNKNKVFTAPIGSSAEGADFKDIFREEDVKSEWVVSIEQDNPKLHSLLFSIKDFGGSFNYCYCVYMAIRLLEIRRVLKESGSMYLHCDPGMSHYLKLVLDCIFGERNFRNEIIWHYGKWSNSARYFQRNHDIIFFYSKTNSYRFNRLYQDFSSKTAIAKYNRKVDERGVAVQDKASPVSVKAKKAKGVAMHDVWDVSFLHPMAKERIGYPTQKPLALMERIISASSKRGDLVLDPFCGCATTCIAAEKLGRGWIGIDVGHKAYEFVKLRLEQEVPADLIRAEPNYRTDPPKRSAGDIGEHENTKFVYIISHPKYPGEYKVGVARDINSRLSSFQTGDPERAYKIEYKKRTSYFNEIERHIHSAFANKGEWVQGDLAKIKRAIGRWRP